MSIADFTALPLERALTAAAAIRFSAREALIAERLRREIVERLEFLMRRGAGVSVARSQCGDAVGRRRTADPAGDADRFEAARGAVCAG